MTIRQLVGHPTSPPAPLRKNALEEHFIDPRWPIPITGTPSPKALTRRSTSSNGVSGSQATLRSAPFTVSRNSVSIVASSSRWEWC
jgi:hypothetical protein